jgi:hypothetical protein
MFLSNVIYNANDPVSRLKNLDIRIIFKLKGTDLFYKYLCLCNKLVFVIKLLQISLESAFCKECYDTQLKQKNATISIMPRALFC